ncbi:MAG: hypothetical protein PHC61_08625 [Chitinivibrionales bacterium]|nr:hypothetical protein [Chitinivibrionales bacterium]
MPALLILMAGHALADVKPLSLTGAFNATGGLYAANGVADRQDPASYRASLTPTVSIYDQLTLPFEFYLSSSGGGFRQPFNQFGVNPHIGTWLTLHGGYFSTQLTDLSFGDTRLLGGGIDVHPSKFRLALLYGRSQKAQQADTVVGLHGLYDRWVAAGMLGVGKTDRNFIALTVLRAADDTSSLHGALAAADSTQLRYYNGPKENLVGTLSWGLRFLKNAVAWRGEIAGSAFSNDATDSVVTNSLAPSWLHAVFTPRYSSQFDAAGKTSLMWTPAKVFQVGLNGRWVGPGYVTLGYAGLPNDLFDITLAPSLRLDNSKYQLRPSFGVRFNNLYNTRIATTNRTIFSFTGVAQPSAAFGFDAQYSNYGTKSNARNDTLRVSNIAQALNAAPHYTFESWGANQVITATYAFQNFVDQNVVTAALDKYVVNSIAGVWSLGWPSTLSLSTTANWVNTAAALVTTTIIGVNEGLSHSFLEKNALTAGINLGYNIVASGKTDGQFTAGATCSYKFMQFGTFSLLLSSNRYDYGAGGSVPSFQEYQGTLQYTLTF